MKTENVSRDWKPMPSQTMNSGASAIFGINWNSTTFGYSMSRIRLDALSSAASATPSRLAIRKPATLSQTVGQACCSSSGSVSASRSAIADGAGSSTSRIEKSRTTASQASSDSSAKPSGRPIRRQDVCRSIGSGVPLDIVDRPPPAGELPGAPPGVRADAGERRRRHAAPTILK
ncbi:MAG: hypothetical protein QM674_07025 [Burkholderiaceae bacterium]